MTPGLHRDTHPLSADLCFECLCSAMKRQTGRFAVNVPLFYRITQPFHHCVIRDSKARLKGEVKRKAFATTKP